MEVRNEMSAKKWLSKHTAKLRHSLIFKLLKHVTPPDPMPRPMVQFLRRRFADKPLIGVEIGVAEGVHAESILETLNIQKLFLIDPYKPFVDARGCSRQSVHAFFKARARLSKFADKIVFMRKTSMDALTDIPDDLDFVYIDGNHAYAYVKDDIQHYYPKVRHGGVLGGHDFSLQFVGVVRAAVEFAVKRDLKLHGEKNRMYCDWWVVKK